MLLCRAVRAGSPRILVAPAETSIAANASEPMDRDDVPHLRLMDHDREDE